MSYAIHSPSHPVPRFEEPYCSEFRSLVVRGTGRIDIHDSPVKDGYALAGAASDRYIDREVYRVELHLKHICRSLKRSVDPTRLLDVGCGTGGLAVALGLTFPNGDVTGVDPDAASVAAASVRAAGYGVKRISFRQIGLNKPLPLPQAHFDLITCTSVLEFITDFTDRKLLIDEIKRLTAPGGHVFITTPNPLWPRELHSKRWFGDWIRKPGYPWALPRWTISGLFRGWTHLSTDDRVQDRLNLKFPLPRPIARAANLASPWQMILLQKPQN